MDDGQVIPGLNENWTFFGAKPMEWVSGFIAGMIFIELFCPKGQWGAYMPLIILVMVGVPVLMANCRKLYPDEERGMRNHLMTLMGMAPVGIPKPSMLQPVWSGAPYQDLKDVKPECKFLLVQLDKVFPNKNKFEEAIKF